MFKNTYRCNHPACVSIPPNHIITRNLAFYYIKVLCSSFTHQGKFHKLRKVPTKGTEDGNKKKFGTGIICIHVYSGEVEVPNPSSCSLKLWSSHECDCCYCKIMQDYTRFLLLYCMPLVPSLSLIYAGTLPNLICDCSHSPYIHSPSPYVYSFWRKAFYHVAIGSL